MDFAPIPVHEEIRKVVREVCANFPDDYWMEHDESREFPWDFYNAIVEGGWLGLTVPTEYGGAGLGVTEAAIVEQEIAASGAGMNGCSAVHIGIFGFEPIIKHGSEELKRRFLPRLVSGDLHVSFAVTEPDAGTDTTNISTFARKVEGGYLVSGRWPFGSGCQESQWMVANFEITDGDHVRHEPDGTPALHRAFTGSRWHAAEEENEHDPLIPAFIGR